jgi:hypothetical protein
MRRAHGTSSFLPDHDQLLALTTRTQVDCSCNSPIPTAEGKGDGELIGHFDTNINVKTGKRYTDECHAVLDKAITDSGTATGDDTQNTTPVFYAGAGKT